MRNLLGLSLPLSLVLFFTLPAAAQRTSFFVAPQMTDPQIDRNLQSHHISINPSSPAKNQLFLFFPGTGGTPFFQQEINHTAADAGFHAIGLTHPNDESVNELCNGSGSADPDCFAKIRLEIKDGTDRSPLVDVTRPNSIENRLIKLLIYLRTARPGENWGQFLLDDQTVNWTKIVVSGHSQGGGHAGIIARFHPITRAVMFAAMDFSVAESAPARWISRPETTPNASAPDKFRGFSHRRDEEVNFLLLVGTVWPAYGMPASGSVVNVDNSAPPYNNSHSLTSNIECANFHGCVVVDARLVRDQSGVPVYIPVWQYLLSNVPAPFGLVDLKFIRFGQVVNRPATGRTTKNYRLAVRGGNFNAGPKITINDQEAATEFVSANELRVSLPSGKFGGLNGTKVQAVNPDGRKTNILVY